MTKKRLTILEKPDPKRANYFKRLLGSSRVSIALPYVWIVLFLILPFITLLAISFSEIKYGAPPYKEILDYVHNTYISIKLYINNYIFIFSDEIYVFAFLNSLYSAFLATLVAAIIGFPFAYAIYQCTPFWRNFLILLVILPFYTSFLIRVYAWIGLLGQHGFINSLLLKLGLISSPLQFMYTDGAVVLGIVYCYLPFMVLPIFVALQKMDHTVLEAAHDLGCRPLRTFFTITLPLARKGLIAGAFLVFIPAIGEFVIPELLGGSKSVMIGRVIWNEFFNNQDWPLASAIAVTMFLLVIGPMNYFQRYSEYSDDENLKEVQGNE